ncbi:MAG: STAS domain-containing protein [Alphaproteobacteria bacterium]
MNIIKDSGQEKLQFGLMGKFTYKDHNAFNDVLHSIATDPAKSVQLDMHDLVFVDSAALGMLLLAHDEAKKNGKRISVTGLGGQVQKMFDMTRMTGMFKPQ